MSASVVNRWPHRLRCITVEAGILNTCPACGRHTATDWHWDFNLDPYPEDGAFVVSEDTDDAFAAALSDIARALLALPCEQCST